MLAWKLTIVAASAIAALTVGLAAETASLQALLTDAVRALT